MALWQHRCFLCCWSRASTIKLCAFLTSLSFAHLSLCTTHHNPLATPATPTACCFPHLPHLATPCYTFHAACHTLPHLLHAACHTLPCLLLATPSTLLATPCHTYCMLLATPCHTLPRLQLLLATPSTLLATPCHTLHAVCHTLPHLATPTAYHTWPRLLLATHCHAYCMLLILPRLLLAHLATPTARHTLPHLLHAACHACMLLATPCHTYLPPTSLCPTPLVASLQLRMLMLYEPRKVFVCQHWHP